MVQENPVSMRQILVKLATEDPFYNDLDSGDIRQNVDQATQQIKQKFAHMRRVLYSEIENNREEDGHISNDKILDIIYNEIDNVIEGLQDENKNLGEMSKRE